MRTSPLSNNNQQLPDEFLKRLRAVYGDAQAEDVIASLTSPRHLSIRVNTLISDDARTIGELSAAGITSTPIPGIPHAYTVESVTARELTDLPAYVNGLFYIQNASSMIPAIVISPLPGENILDMAAAPGSKTTHMAALMDNTGTIIANDSSRERLYKLEANLERYGVHNCKTTRARGETVWQQYPEHFDKTLVDAPCSMEGTFRAGDVSTYKGWSIKHIKRMSSQQKWLLRSAVSATKPGGIIVYSTCTIAPEENEEVIDWILTKEKGKVVIDPISIDEVPCSAPCTSWGNKHYSKDMSGVLRIAPTPVFEGFFVARLKKTEHTVPLSLRNSVDLI